MRDEALTVVIPSQGMEPMLQACLVHLARALLIDGGHADDKVVVVDNASEYPYQPDQRVPINLEWVRFDTHHSFAACSNHGMRTFPNPYYLMLNNDVLLHERAIVSFLDEMKDPQVGICGARLLYPNGTIQHAGIKFGPPERALYHWKREAPSREVPRTTKEFQAVTAACMLLRHTAMEACDYFDETFPFAWEDVDLCLRARQRGWKVVCNHAVDSVHFESMTPGRMEKDPPSQELFLERWSGKWSVDG